MVRHNYVNCTACHVSPTGGGVLTQYGRSISAELLSTAGGEGEAQILHGLFGTPAYSSWLNIGGDARGLQMYTENSTLKQAQWILMQADLEAAAKIGNFTFDSAIGRILNQDQSVGIGSRQYYAMYSFSDELSIRAGKFYAAYGLNLPDHILFIKQDLGFDQGQETNNIEASYLGEHVDAYLTGSTAPGEVPSAQRETSFAGQYSYAFADHYKIGLSHWTGAASQFKRTMLALHGILGFTRQLYLLTESDFQWRSDQSTTETRGVFDFQRLGYEFIKGIHAYLQFEYELANTQDANSTKRNYGGGFEFYPRPHFEFDVQYEKSYVQAVSSDLTDVVWLIIHYYF